MSKQDRQGARTVADLEQRYNFGKSFAEVQGFADDARRAADDAQEAAEKMENLFAGDIYMTGKFQSTSEGYLPPTMDDVHYVLRQVVFGSEEYPTPEGANFDLNGDGVVDADDVHLMHDVIRGNAKLELCRGAEKRPVTICIDMSNPEKAIRIYGTNMWGTETEMYIGSIASDSSFVSKESMKTIIQQDDESTFRYVGTNGDKEYFNPPMEVGVEYRTTERWNGKPVYTKRLEFALPATSGVTSTALDILASSYPTFIEFKMYAADSTFVHDVNCNGWTGGYAYLWTNNTDWYVNYVSNGDNSGYTANVIVKYVYG